MILRRFDPKIMDWIIKPSSIKNFISKNFFSVQNIHHVLTENMGIGTNTFARRSEEFIKLGFSRFSQKLNIFVRIFVKIGYRNIFFLTPLHN